MAKRGHPCEKFMVIEDGMAAPPPAFVEALKEQQRLDLERSLEFAKKNLDLGIRWRSG